MRTTLAALLIVAVSSPLSAHERLNRMLRGIGFGWSDGYHAAPSSGTLLHGPGRVPVGGAWRGDPACLPPVAVEAAEYFGGGAGGLETVPPAASSPPPPPAPADNRPVRPLLPPEDNAAPTPPKTPSTRIRLPSEQVVPTPVEASAFSHGPAPSDPWSATAIGPSQTPPQTPPVPPYQPSRPPSVFAPPAIAPPPVAGPASRTSAAPPGPEAPRYPLHPSAAPGAAPPAAEPADDPPLQEARRFVLPWRR